MKNNKQIIIDAPEGKVIDLEHFNQTGNVRFIDEKPAKIEFPKEWEVQKQKYFYINDDARIVSFMSYGSLSPVSLRNSLPSKSLAEQMLIFTQLITMRERYREIEKLNNPELGDIDWGNGTYGKHCVLLSSNKIEKTERWNNNHAFSFQLSETRDEFAKNFGYMILQCKDILG